MRILKHQQQQFITHTNKRVALSSTTQIKWYNGRYRVYTPRYALYLSIYVHMRYGTVFECIFTQKYLKIIIIKEASAYL